MAKGNSREIGNNLLKGAFAGLVMWLLYIANKDDVEMFDLKINIELFNKWSTNGIFSFLGKVSLFAAIVNVIGALVYYSRYSNAPEVLCPACSLTYRDEVGDGVCHTAERTEMTLRKQIRRRSLNGYAAVEPFIPDMFHPVLAERTNVKEQWLSRNLSRNGQLFPPQWDLMLLNKQKPKICGTIGMRNTVP